MCNGGGAIEVAPAVQTQTVGNNSSVWAEHQNLKDSVQTHLTLNIAGGSAVLILLILAAVVIFMVWRGQKIAFSIFHQRLHHLSKFVEFPGNSDENKIDSESPIE